MTCSIESISDTALLGVLVGPRAARRLLQDANGSLAQLLHETVRAGCSSQLPHHGNVKLQAACELVRRSLAEQMKHRDALRSPQAVREYLRVKLAHLEHEVFMVLLLDSQHRVIAAEELFRGSLSQTSVYPQELVKRALAYNAAAVILAHNHPSGVAEPSRADEYLTQTLRQSLSLVEARVIDHVIVAGSSVVSFVERGLL